MPDHGTGDFPGMSRALLDVLRAYRPSPNGVAQVSEEMLVTLPVSEWCDYAWMERVTVTLPIGSSAALTVFTVPNDERIHLGAMVARRVTGDNTISAIRVVYPEGYGSLTREAEIISVTATTRVYWPDVGGTQTISYVLQASPLLLEPGSTIAVVPDGAGVATTDILSYLAMTRTKMVRAIAGQV